MRRGLRGRLAPAPEGGTGHTRRRKAVVTPRGGSGGDASGELGGWESQPPSVLPRPPPEGLRHSPRPSPTHQLGALVRAVAREDEGLLLRGDGHHGRVHQAQLHDARVEASQAGRVVEADARGVAPAWEAGAGVSRGLAPPPGQTGPPAAPGQGQRPSPRPCSRLQRVPGAPRFRPHAHAHCHQADMRHRGHQTQRTCTVR